MPSLSTATGPVTHASSWRRPVAFGLLGGVVAAAVMAMVAMGAAATYQNTGFFTPLYHIGSAFGSSETADAMKASMDRAMAGDLYYFDAGPAARGIAIHLVAGAAWGAVFGLFVRAVRATRAAVLAAGAAFGFIVLVVMTSVVLPAVAELFDSGPPIRDMPDMVGWGTFLAEHVVFGVAVGLTALAFSPRGATAGERRALTRSRTTRSDRRVPAS